MGKIRDYYEIKVREGRILVYPDKIIAEEVPRYDQILTALASKEISKGIYEPREWVKRYFELKRKWQDTLNISIRHKISASPNNLPTAARKLRMWGSTKKAFFEIASIFFRRKVSYLDEKYRRLQLHLNWLATIMAGKELKFVEIGGGGSYIKNPKLPIKIKTSEMALLLGIISGDGSFYAIKTQRGDKLVLAIISTRKEFLDWANKIVCRIFGNVKPSIYRVSDKKLQYRYYNVLITESLIMVGAHVGRKTKDFKMPEWIKKSPRYIAMWFRGLLEGDGNIKINIKKKDIQVRYARNVEIKLPDHIIKQIIDQGKYIEKTGQYVLPKSKIPIEIKSVPRIIQDEKEAIKKLTGKAPAINVERIFYNTLTEKTKTMWVVTTYGKHAIEILRKTKPPRLMKRLESQYTRILDRAKNWAKHLGLSGEDISII